MTHGSKELDEDAKKIIELGADPGLSLSDLKEMEEDVVVKAIAGDRQLRGEISECDAILCDDSKKDIWGDAARMKSTLIWLLGRRRMKRGEALNQIIQEI